MSEALPYGYPEHPFVVRIAGHAIGFRYLDDFMRRQYTGYMAPDGTLPEYEVGVTEDDIKAYARRTGIEHPRYLLYHADIACWLLRQNVLHIHASALMYDGRAFLFSAPSGTGKSTHARGWRETFGTDVTMICDDKPFLRFEADRIVCCGSPWNGKHGLGSNIEAPLGAICMLAQGAENRISRMDGTDAFFALHQQVHPLNDPAEADRVHQLMDRLCRDVPVFHLTCTAEPDAARLARRVITAADR